LKQACHDNTTRYNGYAVASGALHAITLCNRSQVTFQFSANQKKVLTQNDFFSLDFVVEICWRLCTNCNIIGIKSTTSYLAGMKKEKKKFVFFNKAMNVSNYIQYLYIKKRNIGCTTIKSATAAGRASVRGVVACRAAFAGIAARRL
jgi:hypothetical protein